MSCKPLSHQFIMDPIDQIADIRPAFLEATGQGLILSSGFYDFWEC